MEFINDYIKKLLRWLGSVGSTEIYESDPAKKLLKTMRLTAKSRFNASARLKNLGGYSFFTTTVLSLGLIFIPLYQNSGLPLPYTFNVLSILQIFLAVAVLVYSVVNATAKYDLRATVLNNCGVQLKGLIRELRREISESTDGNVNINLKSYHSKYQVIEKETENHNPVDYNFTILQTPNDFRISGIPRFLLYTKSCVICALPYIIPTSMMGFEVFIITDILGVTEVFKKVFT